MHLHGRLAMAALLILAAVATASAGEIRLTIRNGAVTLVAKDVTARQILAEWARVGKTKVVNGERVPGPPLTLELVNVPEARALDTVLRSVSGFMAAHRAVPDPEASVYDRILVMPTTAPSAAATAMAQRPSPSPQQFRLQQPGFMRGPGAVVSTPPDQDETDEEAADDEPADDPDEDPAEPARPPNAPAGLRQPGMVPTTVPPHPIDPYQGDGNTPADVLNGTRVQGLAPGVSVPGVAVPNPMPATPVIPPPPKPPKKGSS